MDYVKSAIASIGVTLSVEKSHGLSWRRERKETFEEDDHIVVQQYKQVAMGMLS